MHASNSEKARLWGKIRIDIMGVQVSLSQKN